MSDPCTKETYSTRGPICPHCGYTETPDEAFYFDEDTTQIECMRCEATYSVRVYKETSWTSQPAPAIGASSIGSGG